MDRTFRHEVDKEISSLNDALAQTNIINIYSTFHFQTTAYKFFSSTLETLSRTDHMLGHKKSLNKFKKTEIISSIFSDHNVMKLEIKNKRKAEKNLNYVEIKPHATKKLLGQRRHERNQNIHRDK